MRPRARQYRELTPDIGVIKLIAAVAVIIALAAVVYFSGDFLERLLKPEPPDSAAIAAAVESAYVRIKPVSVSTSSSEIGGNAVRLDYVELSRSRSLLRANLEITRAVERAGGEVLYGIESRDEHRRKQFLTLGISNGEGLVCEVKLGKRAD